MTPTPILFRKRSGYFARAFSACNLVLNGLDSGVNSRPTYSKNERQLEWRTTKPKPTELSVAAFIDAITDPTKRADAKALVKLMQDAAGEKPKMWGASIIGFGSYHYKYESGREGDMPLIGFSPRKTATVLYNMIGSSDSKALLAKLGKHTDRQGLPLHQEAR
jgi:hypothetical protein